MIILLSGKAGSGKDTVYNIIEKYLNPNSKYAINLRKFAFAQSVKKITKSLTHLYLNLDLPIEQLDNQAFKETAIPGYNLFLDYGQRVPLKPRILFQQIATNILRNELDSDIFARKVANDINDFFSKFMNDSSRTLAVITDLRFPNEQSYIMEYFHKHYVGIPVVTILIERNNTNKNMVTSEQHHISENLFNDIKSDWIIDNNGTLNDLEKQVKDIVSNYYPQN